MSIRVAPCLVVLSVLASACTPPTPISVTCDAETQQSAHCMVSSLRGARVEIRAGDKPLGEALPAGSESGEIEVPYASIPFDVQAIRFVATMSGRSPGSASWTLPAVRYRASLAGDDLRFEVPHGETIRVNDAPLTVSSDGLAHVHLDLIGDLAADEVERYVEREIHLAIKNERGQSLEDTLTFAPDESAITGVRVALRKHGTPLPWAAPWTHAHPRPAILVVEEYGGPHLRPLGGLKHISEAQLVVFAAEEEYADVGSCGIYQNAAGAMVPVNRMRMHRQVEAFEARTGAPVAKKVLYGGVPRDCRDREKVQTIDGSPLPQTIDGSPVDDNAIDAWLASLP